MKTLAIVLSLCVLGALGCASTAGIRSEPLEAGIVREFSDGYARVLPAARDAVVSAGLSIDTFAEVNDTTAVIVAKKDASWLSSGELVRVVVQQGLNDRTAVRVITKRKVATQVFAKGDYADTIFSNIALALR